MPAKPSALTGSDDADPVASAVASTAKFEQALEDLKAHASKVAQDTINTLKSRAEPYVGDAGEHIQTAERYMVEKMQKQPIPTALAILGVGVLVGLILGSGGRSSR